MIRISILLVGLMAAACGAAQPDFQDVPGLDGTWLLRGTPTYQSCTGRSFGFPFSPEAVEVETDAEGMTISSERAGRLAYAGSGKLFTRQVEISDDTCDAVSTSTWQITAVSQTMLSAVLQMDAASSTRAETCVVRFAVSGVRP